MPPLEAGGTLTLADADAAAHRFFEALAGGRDLVAIADPLEHVRRNALLLLLDTESAEVFETYLQRMPEARQAQWRDLIAGGASSEAFGPLTLQERLDARQVEEALATGRRQRTINVLVTAAAALALIVVGLVLWRVFGPGPSRSQGSLQFSSPAESDGPLSVQGGSPVAVPELTVALDEQVVVRTGSEPVDDRVVTDLIDIFPVAPGAVSASLFSFDGVGQVALVGPDGFADGACFRISVVTSDLRPLNTIRTDGCVDDVGQPASLTCVGSSALMLGLSVPSGEVELPEGGVGFADGVRLQLIVDGGADYQLATLRGTIAVDPADAVAVPSFGGSVGDELTVDLGAGRNGQCTLLAVPLQR